MARGVSFGLFLVKPKYGLALSLCLCVVTVVVSLYFLDDLTLKAPQLTLLPQDDDHVIGERHVIGEDDHMIESDIGDGRLIRNHMLGVEPRERQPVILNDIEIEVANSSIDETRLHAGAELKNLTKHLELHHRELNERVDQKIIETYPKEDVPKLTSREKYIIYYCPKNITCCGWGDRQHGILSAYVISLVTNRTFGVDMSSPCLFTNLFHPRKLNWKINSTALEGLTTKHLYTVNDKVFRQVMGQIDFDEVYPQDVIYLTTNYDYFYALKNNPRYKQIFRQKLQSKPRPIVFADLWQTVFKLNRPVKRKLNNAISRAKPTKNYKLVCAHLRFGKNPTLPSDSEVRNTMESISVIWDFLKAYKDPHKYKVFIASDSEQVRQKARLMFPLQTVDVEGDIIHIDKSKRTMTNACQGFEKVLADQYLLSMCDVLVLTYSVFGKGAAYMRRSNENLYFLEDGEIKPLKVLSERVSKQQQNHDRS